MLLPLMVQFVHLTQAVRLSCCALSDLDHLTGDAKVLHFHSTITIPELSWFKVLQNYCYQ